MSKEFTEAIKREKSKNGDGPPAESVANTDAAGSDAPGLSAQALNDLKRQIDDIQQALQALGQAPSSGASSAHRDRRSSALQEPAGAQPQQAPQRDARRNPQQQSQQAQASSFGSSGGQLMQQVSQFSAQIQVQQKDAMQQLQKCIEQGVNILNQTSQYFQAFMMLTQMQQLSAQTKQQLSRMSTESQVTQQQLDQQMRQMQQSFDSPQGQQGMQNQQGMSPDGSQSSFLQ